MAQDTVWHRDDTAATGRMAVTVLRDGESAGLAAPDEYRIKADRPKIGTMTLSKIIRKNKKGGNSTGHSPSDNQTNGGTGTLTPDFANSRIRYLT
jgi:hypothetical protein